MLHLAVTTRLNDVVVDTCTVPMDRARVVGDSPDADAVFPGPVLMVQPTPDGVTLGPITLKTGGRLTLELEEVEVEFTVVRRAMLARDRFIGGDVRMLVAMGALLLFGMWWDTMHRWTTHNDEVVAELEALPALWSRIRGEAPEPPADAEPTVRAPEVQFRLE